MSGKFALIIGNTEYIDPGLAQLTAPGKDAEDFARILKDKDLCAFDEVKILLNQLSSSVIETVDEFFDQKKPDDMLVLYFSGHGVRDEMGLLYLAVKNTIRSRLRSTAIRSDYIREAMDQSRSKRQILILDCCNSGAFPQGTKAEVGGAMGMTRAFQGYGRFVLTASDATQFAWEGDQVIGQTENSLFTHFLVKGLEGEADRDGDGKITVDELYDFAYDQISRVTPKQTPTKSASKQEGEIILRQITRLEDIKPVSLPEELIEATGDSRTFVREGAVQQLEKLLKGKNLGLARSAREALERIEKEDDSRRVSQAATQALETVRQAETAEEERKTREEAERITAQKAEEEQIALEKVEAERRAEEQAERLLAEQKDEEERKAKKEERRLATLKAKEETERIAKQNAEQDRLARAKAEAERLGKQKVEKERLAPKKTESVRKANPKAEAERIARENRLAEKKVDGKNIATLKSQQGEINKSTTKHNKPAKFFMLPVGIGVAIAIFIFGYAAIIFLPRIIGDANPTELPMQTEIGPGEGEVSIISWAGYIERGETDPNFDWVTQFEADTSCKVTNKVAATSDEMVALMNEGGFDLVTASGDASNRLISGGRVQELNLDLIPSYDSIDPRLQNAPWHTVDTDGDGTAEHYGVPYSSGQNILMYNTEIFGDQPPTSWDVVFQEMTLPDGESNAGRIQAYDAPIYIADAALYLKYHNPELGIEDPYSLTREQFDAAINLLREQRKLINRYWHDAAIQMDDFTNEGVAASSSWPFQANLLKAGGAPIEKVVPVEGATGWADSTMMHVDAPHPNCAYKWLEWSLNKKLQGDLAAWFQTIPVRLDACEGNELLGSDGCKNNGLDNFDQIVWWRTPTANCGDGRMECIPYNEWATNYVAVMGGR